MSGRLVFSEELTRTTSAATTRWRPGRVQHTISLARQLGVLDRLEIVAPPPIDLDVLATVHTPDYIDAVERGEPDERYGLGNTDNPIFPGMHEVSARVVDGHRRGGPERLVGRGAAGQQRGGGLHHAMPDRTSGFCVYNDLAMAIHWLLDNGCERVAYVDVDVHHGDGVQAIFWDDPRVLTVSLHETPAYLFPGTGFPHEIGGRGRRGECGQRRAAAGDRRRRLAAGLPRDRAGGAARRTSRRS